MDFWSVTLTLLEGFGTTCLLFALTLVFSLPLGLVIAFGSMSKFKPLSWFCRVVVWVIRGTPLMLQLFVVYYGPLFLSRAYNIDINAWWKEFPAAVVAFVINYACYFSEIYRGGIESIPRGQYEAAQVLGMTKTETFFKVILMQVVKRILAPMSNEVITLVKDTSLAQVIGVTEIFATNTDHYMAFAIIWPLFYTAVFFLIFVGVLTILFNFLEKKLSYYKI